ncbi:metal transporter Nramp2-like [Dendrobium catenatum]|uniref:Metal transporter Nramp2 n=1 Tax=Dendrobium catenatum TaxID=906689 RepID=A0A2I0W7Y0_9ASPA|nr:metal transporter Nramp2-like [Dendrobium catenatum]PKU71752.1 Metal transporter Nramp2 [Dendrobium catenatum]
MSMASQEAPLLPADDSDGKVIISVSDEEWSEVEANDGLAPPFSWRKLWRFTGPGFLMCIAFLDPGSLEGDLQAGAIAGYSLLWLLLWATAMGLLIQLLSAKLGVATGRHLAELCREEYPQWAGIVLWVMAELALIASDIQEVVGSAIAIRILSGGVIPLWVGVLITALDCFIFLFLESYGVRKLEAFFAVLIATMAISFAIMFGETKPSRKDLLIGLLVPKVSPSTITQAVGLVGCVITPHNVFLHSALVQSRKINTKRKSCVTEAIRYYYIESAAALTISFVINFFATTVFAKSFYGTKIAGGIGLENAGHVLQEKYGAALFPILYIWGLGLLASGQSSTITSTYAGQFIMEGFRNLHMKKWIRALITRSCAVVPAIIVALCFDSSDTTVDALNESLNSLQSIQVPFALIPLIKLVSKEQVMGFFRIGFILKTLAWIVAAFLIAINGYLLVDYFSNEMQGLLLTSIICVFLMLYLAFVIYLIVRDDSLSVFRKKSPNPTT